MTLPNFTTLTREEALAFILSGMQTKRAEIDATLRDLRSQLHTPNAVPRESPSLQQFIDPMEVFAPRTNEPHLPKRRKMSRAARKAISDAQKRRWAKVRG